MPYLCRIKCGNLLDEPDATFMLNASNTVLQLGSGVSAAFKERCGSVLQEEMTRLYRTLPHPLQKGDVVATSAGEAAHIRYVLHGCVMDYRQSVKGTDRYPTYRDIATILEQTERYLQWYADTYPQETLKLVLPLLGCGVGGLDAEEVLKLYRNHFAREVPFLCEVVVYAYSLEDYKLAQRICQRE